MIDKKVEEKVDFFSHIKSSLTLSIEGQSIDLASNPHFFLAKLRDQAKLAGQEPVTAFLQEICEKQNSSLTVDEIDAFIAKYLTPPRMSSSILGDSGDNDMFLNISADDLKKFNDARALGDPLGECLAPIVEQALVLVKTNMCRPISVFQPGGTSYTIVTPTLNKQLLDAYEVDKQDKHDKLMLPVRTILCGALEAIETKPEKENTKKTGGFWNTLRKPIINISHQERNYTLIAHEMGNIELRLTRLLTESTQLEKKPEDFQKELKDIVGILEGQKKLLTDLLESKSLDEKSPLFPKIAALGIQIEIAKEAISKFNSLEDLTRLPTLTKPLEKHMEQIRKNEPVTVSPSAPEPTPGLSPRSKA